MPDKKMPPSARGGRGRVDPEGFGSDYFAASNSVHSATADGAV